MFTKNFNSLSDSLIEATKKIMTEGAKKTSKNPSSINYDHEDDYERREIDDHIRDADAEYGKAKREKNKKMSEASNEAPNIQRLTLTQNEEMMPKGMSMKERTAFHMAAAAAAKEGKSHFEFGGKKYPATMSKDVASKMNEESINEDDRRAIRKEIDKARAAGKPIPSIATVRARLAKAAAKKAVVKKPVANPPPKADSEDPEESARKHPIDRLRRIALSTGGAHFEFDNGEKHKISRDVARTIVKHYEVPSEQGGLKPYQKEKLQGEITKSHDHLMKHYNSISGTNEAKKLDEVPVETIKQVRTFNVEETDDETPPFEPDKKKKYTDSAKSRATWLAKHARDAMKKKMKTEQVKPGGDMAPNIHIPEGQTHTKPQKMDAKPSSERKPLEDRLGEEPIDEREMTKAEMNKREKIVMRLKDKMAGFKKRYGERAKDVMYATATKMAMKEETPKGKTMTGQKADPVEINPSAPTKEGIGVKSTTT